MRVHGTHHRVGNRRGDFVEQVDQLVHVESGHGGGEPLRAAFVDQMGTHFLAGGHQYLADHLGIEALPQRHAVIWRQRFEQAGDLGRMHLRQQRRGLGHLAGKDQLTYLDERAGSRLWIGFRHRQLRLLWVKLQPIV